MNKKALQGLIKEEEFKVKLKDTKSCIKDIEAELETLYVREPEEVEYISRVERILDEQYEILDKLIKNEIN